MDFLTVASALPQSKSWEIRSVAIEQVSHACVQFSVAGEDSRQQSTATTTELQNACLGYPLHCRLSGRRFLLDHSGVGYVVFKRIDSRFPQSQCEPKSANYGRLQGFCGKSLMIIVEHALTHAAAPPRTSLRWFDPPPQTSFGEGGVMCDFTRSAKPGRVGKQAFSEFSGDGLPLV
ncbi:hypothetical protein Poly24_01010 [Rosistilla carotiformis]|uniref:Uncharacterized protein n=1 Tax=Rosistilla carotiformis TaxID=2528017 RepID=A0A518JLI4_9BACT|nr:hypothetical protein Poly24_01010 [Rosistilla carotiformis]